MLVAGFLAPMVLVEANASVLCGKDAKDIWSAKISAGGQVFTSNPSTSSSSSGSQAGSSSSGLNSYTTTAIDSSFSSSSNIFNDGFIGLGEIIYKPANSRLSYGAGYSYGRYTTSSSTSSFSSFSSSTIQSFQLQQFAYSQAGQSSSSGLTPKTDVVQQAIRLSGYWDISDAKWKIKPYLLAAIAAVNTKTQGTTTTFTSSSTGSTSSGGIAEPSSAQTTASISQGATNSWGFNPELGIGVDIPLNKSISLGSELRYVLTGTNTSRPIVALGYIKYTFNNDDTKGLSSAASCETISVKSNSAPALQRLLGEASESELEELKDYLIQKRKLESEHLQN
jgi:hypothetical protein